MTLIDLIFLFNIIFVSLNYLKYILYCLQPVIQISLGVALIAVGAAGVAA